MTRAQFFEKLGAIVGEHRFDRDSPHDITSSVFDAAVALANAVDKMLPFETTEDKTSFQKGTGP